jgi:hypothetical protein
VTRAARRRLCENYWRGGDRGMLEIERDEKSGGYIVKGFRPA